MISLKRLLQVSFHFTEPKKIDRKDWWLAFIYPIIIGFFLALFPFLVWETAFFLVVIKLLPSEIMTVLNFIVKIVAFVAFAIPFLYTYIIVSVKRLHDVGHSGFWWLINLIPVIIFFILNEFGYDARWTWMFLVPLIILSFFSYLGFVKSRKNPSEIDNYL